MPAYSTHYLFGRISFAGLREGRLKRLLRQYPEVYALGLAGPDIFFYFVPDQLLPCPKPGTVLHEQACGAFLRRMLKETLCLEGREREIAAAYLAGFIGHYELDGACHPHVYAYVGEQAKKRGITSGHEKTGIHFQYECAMDYYFLRRYAGRSASELDQRRITRLDRQERRVIAGLVAVSYNKTYERPNLTRGSMRAVLACVRLVMGLVRDGDGKKEKRLQPLEKRLYGHSFLCGLFINSNRYGVGRDEWERMDVLFRKGLGECHAVYEALEEVLRCAQGNEAGLRAAKKRFFRQLGSRSYHTGETV
ncbi:MAG: zinc dependent phospholipase C family protein [Lachnospiraceae bacterium]|nr:zinc dependent phospholipase C family protein [Lachnospiraceae bacterium]